MQVAPSTDSQRTMVVADSSSLPYGARMGSDAQLMRTQRVLKSWFPQSGGTYGPALTKIIRFDVASTDFLDLSEARFQCDFTATHNGQDVTQTLDGGLGGCISRLTITSNISGLLLERIDDYALVQTLLNQCSDRARLDPSALLEQEMFITDPANIDAANYMMTANTVRQLSHKLHGAWFQTSHKKLLPPGVSFKVEIELVGSANECCKLTGAAADQTGFTLSNCSLVIPTVTIESRSFEERTMQLLQTGWTWTGATYTTNKYSSNAAGARNLTVPGQALALTGLIAVIRLNNSLSATNAFQNYFREGGGFQSDYNVTIGSDQYPPLKIQYSGGTLTDQNVIGNGTNYKFAEATQQIAAVLGYASFVSTAAHKGQGFIAVQTGYGQGQGVDTQSAALNISFNLNPALNTDAEICVITQSTSSFRLESRGGAIEVTNLSG